MTTPRVAVLGGLFVAGGLAGAGGAALFTAADEDPVHLVAGEQTQWQVGPAGGFSLTIDIYNPDEREVGVEPLAVGDWEKIDESSEPVSAAARAWTAMTVEVAPDCSGDIEPTLDVASDGVAREVALDDDVVANVDRQRQRYCGADGLVLNPTVESKGRDGDAYVLDVRLPGHGRTGLGEVTIDGVLASVPYRLEAEGLPATLPVEGSITLTTRWSFSCSPDAGGPDGETAPYDAMFLTTPDGIRIHADISPWLYPLWVRECTEPQ